MGVKHDLTWCNMFKIIAIFILIFNTMTININARRFDPSHYIPYYRQYYPEYPSSIQLQTHDRSLVDPSAPKSILNHRDFSENNPFTVPAGTKGIDRYFHLYLNYHVKPIGISSALRNSQREVIVNRNSRLKRTGGVRMKSRRMSNRHFPSFKKI